MSVRLQKLQQDMEHKLEFMKRCDKATWSLRQSQERATREYKEAFNAYRELLYKEFDGVR